MPPVPITDDTFCIAVLGDFLGESSADREAADVLWNPRRATPDTVFGLTGLRPRIRAAVGDGEESEEVGFSSLESFDPWNLFQRLSFFASSREARGLAEKGPQDSGPPAGDGGNLLDAILDQAQPSPPGGPPRGLEEVGTKEELGAFVREVVRPHLVQDDADLPARVAAVDEEASARMSALLHSLAFQRLEALWRSLVALLSRIDSTGKTRVYLVHLPRAELEQDLMEADDPLRSRLYDLLGDPQLGVQGRRWSVVVGAYGFRVVPSEISLLNRVARVAQAADVPWLSSIRPRTAADSGHDERGLEAELENPPAEWIRLRESPEAAWMGLTYPRFLLREPFEASPRQAKVFEFRERIASAGDLLWGDGAFLSAALLAQGFATGGWGFRTENHLELAGMPLAGSGEGSDSPPTSVEIRLNVARAKGLTRAGLIPLLAFPEQAGVRVGGTHSIAALRQSLAAWWRR